MAYKTGMQVNGVLIDPAIGRSYSSGKVQVKMNGPYARVETDFGLAVENDGRWTALVKLPPEYNNLTEGLCGNSNQDNTDEFITRHAIDVSGVSGGAALFGHSWQEFDEEDPR